jgi:UDP-glucose 4-epimerase
VNDLYRTLALAAGLGTPAEHGPQKPGEQRRSCLNPALAKRCLGWAPTVSLDDGLGRTLEFFRREIDRTGKEPRETTP